MRLRTAYRSKRFALSKSRPDSRANSSCIRAGFIDASFPATAPCSSCRSFTSTVMISLAACSHQEGKQRSISSRTATSDGTMIRGAQTARSSGKPGCSCCACARTKSCSTGKLGVKLVGSKVLKPDARFPWLMARRTFSVGLCFTVTTSPVSCEASSEGSNVMNAWSRI